MFTNVESFLYFSSNRIHFYFLQKEGKKRIRIVKSSRRPTNINKEINHFPISGIKAKLPFTPDISVPRPVFYTAERDIKNPSFNGRPIITSNVPPITITTIYKNKKASVFISIGDGVPLPFNVTVVMAFGCINL